MSASADDAAVSAREPVHRVAAIDWERVYDDLDARGNARIERLLARDECDDLTALYSTSHIFRSRVLMQCHGFGQGEYKYFSYPLPDTVAGVRAALYPYLARVADRWNAAMGIDVHYPRRHNDFIARCHAAGPIKPTPLLLRYGMDDYNCLHQDVYGVHVFPLQVTLLLSAPERDFSGGEFVIMQQWPRRQSRPEVVPLRQGDAVVFAFHRRPVPGARGISRVNLRHGVSRVRAGHRYALGVIFHDAE